MLFFLSLLVSIEFYICCFVFVLVQHLDRLHPTASVRRRRRHVNGDEEHVELEEAEPQMEVEDEDAPEVEGEGYPGGPRDGTLLTSYEDHVAMQLCNGVVSKYVVLSYLFIVNLI